VRDLQRDAKSQNVIKFVHIQAECEDPIGEVQWLQKQADEHGVPSGIVGWAHLSENIKQLEEKLDIYHHCHNVRGIRQLLNWHDDPSLRFTDKGDYMVNDVWQKGFALLQRYNLSFDLQIYAAHQADQAIKLAKMFPSLLLILNHTGMPVDRSEEGIELWKKNMTKLSKAPNIVVKISGLGMVDHHFTSESLSPFILHTISSFGVNRCMFASNFPIDKVVSSYDKVWSDFKECVHNFSQAEQHKMLCTNAIKYYRL